VTLYRQDADGLAPVGRILAGGGTYEREIQKLAWQSLAEFTGEELFLVSRDVAVPNGRVDIVALTMQGELVLVEVSGLLDRTRLAESLEHSGWAGGTSLAELAFLYHAGATRFVADWQAFTGSTKPMRIQRTPLIVHLTGQVDDRTSGAIAYLADHDVPLRVVVIAVYEEPDGTRFVDVRGAAEPPPDDSGGPSDAAGAPTPDVQRRASSRVGLPDLITAGLLEADAELFWSRPRAGEEYQARMADGQVVLPDGRAFATPSAAAMAAANLPSCDGWHAWRVGSSGGPFLGDLRVLLDG
jgi:hypothetical protein